ncbi:MAG: hypothetical protein COB24_11845 [Hyphomicrobiales bacterium]|nr:MAG: hypothetical protein COB24_11845 [Hyphomicrobiales bacterium]
MSKLELIPQNFEAIFVEAEISDHLSSIASRMLNNPEAFVKNIVPNGDWLLFLADKTTEAEVKLETFLQIEQSGKNAVINIENIVAFKPIGNIKGADHYTRGLGDDDGGCVA